VQPSFLLIAYDGDKGHDIEHAMHKAIDKNQYNLLREDFCKQVELNDTKYDVTQKRFCCISFMATTKTYIVIIEIKYANVQTIQQ
jgi:hypothetical protein